VKEKINLLYLSNERFPSRLACTIQQTAMCDAFVKAGARVTLIYPRYHDAPPMQPEQILAFYGMDSTFCLRTIPSLLSLSKPLVDGKPRLRIPFVGGVSVLLSAWVLALKMLFTGALHERTVIYSRSVNSAYVFLLLKRRCVRTRPLTIAFEVHSLDQQHPKKYFHALLRRADALICISDALKQALVRKVGVSPEKIFVAPDGVKESYLQNGPSRKEARRALGLPDKRIVLYTGQLLPGKGAEVFVDAARNFDDDVLFLLVGGHGDYLRKLQKRVNEIGFSNVIMTGFMPPDRIPIYQSAADVLVLPPTADHEISAYTSPLKLFEYMASRRPIAASDLPVLREILHDGENALLFAEGNADDLAQKISRLLDDPAFAESLAGQAFLDVQHFTWKARAQRILDFIRQRESENGIIKTTQYSADIH